MLVTGWDNLALQTATIKWWGEGTCVALIVISGFIGAQFTRACFTYTPSYHLDV